VPDDQLTGLDRWILGVVLKVRSRSHRGLRQYEFHVVYQKISQFIAVNFPRSITTSSKDRALHRPGEFAASPLDADRAASSRDRPLPDAFPDSGVHG